MTFLESCGQDIICSVIALPATITLFLVGIFYLGYFLGTKEVRKR